MGEIVQECGKPYCDFYGQIDMPDDPLPCPDDHVVDRHPAADDPDWRGATYRYRDSSLSVLETTQVPIDEESALAYFHQIYRYGEAYQDVMYVEMAPPGEHNKFAMLPYRFVNNSVEKLTP